MTTDRKTLWLTTLKRHAPGHRGGCRCGWAGGDLVEHVEAELRREWLANGLVWGKPEEPTHD